MKSTNSIAKTTKAKTTANTYKGFKINDCATHSQIGKVVIVDFNKKFGIAKVKLDRDNQYYSSPKKYLLVPIEFLKSCK